MKTVEVKESSIGGRGVFADESIGKGEIILAIDDSHIVTGEEQVSDEEKDHVDYLSNGKMVVMQSPEAYINHSCDPNTYVKTINAVRNVIAIRDIKNGEEIAYDYAINGDYSWGEKCRCGSSNCRGIVEPNFWKLPRSKQVEYLPYLDDWFIEKYQIEIVELKNS